MPRLRCGSRRSRFQRRCRVAAVVTVGGSISISVSVSVSVSVSITVSSSTSGTGLATVLACAYEQRAERQPLGFLQEGGRRSDERGGEESLP